MVWRVIWFCYFGRGGALWWEGQRQLGSHGGSDHSCSAPSGEKQRGTWRGRSYALPSKGPSTSRWHIQPEPGLWWHVSSKWCYQCMLSLNFNGSIKICNRHITILKMSEFTYWSWGHDQMIVIANSDGALNRNFVVSKSNLIKLIQNNSRG